LRKRVDLAVTGDLDDLLLDRLADALELLRPPCQREFRDRARGLADLRGGAAVGPDPVAVLPLELHQVGEEVELCRELRVPRQGVAHGSMIFLQALRATICLPTYNERDNLDAMLRALGGVLREGDRVLVIDDGSPDGTGELADRLAD